MHSKVIQLYICVCVCVCVCVCLRALFFRFISIIGYYKIMNIVSWLSSKESACQRGDAGLIPGSERSPGERTGNPLQYSCLGNPMERGAWWATVHAAAKSLT